MGWKLVRTLDAPVRGVRIADFIGQLEALAAYYGVDTEIAFDTDVPGASVDIELYQNAAA